MIFRITSSSRILRWWPVILFHRLPHSYLNSQKDCKLHAIKVLYPAALPHTKFTWFVLFTTQVRHQWLTDLSGKAALTDFFWETLLASISVRRTVACRSKRGLPQETTGKKEADSVSLNPPLTTSVGCWQTNTTNDSADRNVRCHPPRGPYT